MRSVVKLMLVCLIAALAAGPALAAPLVPTSSTTVAAPHSSGSPHRSPLGTLGTLAAVAFGITISKDTGTLAKKFVTRAMNAAPDYKAGVAGKGGEWETRTKEAEGAYEQGVTEALGQKRWAKGVQGSGAKYQQNAETLGATRYGPGVQNAEQAWVRGVQPALDVLKGLQLPAPGPRRSQQNQNRATAVMTALGALKTRG